MLYLNKRSSLLDAVFLPHLFIQTGTRATPHVGGDFPVINTLARASAMCGHVGSKILRIYIY